MKETFDPVTRVGWYRVKVRDAKFPSILTFKNGKHGKYERGEYCMWTAVLKEPYQDIQSGRFHRYVMGRARAIEPVGDRFDRMKREMKTLDPAYRFLWVTLLKRGRNIAYIRPSTFREIRRWLSWHTNDERGLCRISVQGVIRSWHWRSK